MTGRQVVDDSELAVLTRRALELETSLRRTEEERDRFLEAVADREGLLEQLRASNQQLVVASLRNSELAEQLDAVFRSMSDAVVIYDAEGAVIGSNPAAAERYGLDAANTSQQDPGDGLAHAQRLSIRHPDGRPADPEELPFARALRGETVVMERFLFVDARGNEAAVDVSASPLGLDSRVVGAVTVGRDVTERVRTQEELDRLLEENRRQRGFLEQLVEVAPIGIAVVSGPDHRFELANPAYRAIPGIPDLEMSGRTFAQLFPPELAARGSAMLDEVYRTGRRIRLTDDEAAVGTARSRSYWNVDLVPLPGPEGAVGKILILSRETTQQVLARHRAEAMAAVASELNRGGGLREGVRAALIRATKLLGGEGGSLLLLQEDGRHLLGALELWAGKGSNTLLELDEWPHYRQAVEAGEPIYVAAEEARGAESTIFHLLGIQGCLVSPLVVAGCCLGVLCMNFRRKGYMPPPEDLASAGAIAGQCALAIERARAEEARDRALEELERERSRLVAVFDSAPEGIVFADDRCRILLANPAADRLYARPVPYGEGFEAQAQLQLCYPDGVPYEPRDLPLTRAALDGETARNVEMAIRWPDGQRRDLLVNTAPILDGQGGITGAVGVFQDITQRKREERFREEYVSLVSHDLRNPLASIKGHAQLLQRMLTRCGMARETQHAEVIIRGADRMNAMISDLVETIRLEAGQLEPRRTPTDLCRLLPEALERACPPEDLARIRLELPEGMQWVAVDSGHIERVLANFVSNGLKYSPPETEVRVTLATSGDDLTISVADRGVGITPEDRDRIFERFYRAEAQRSTSGLGLGLYISRMLVEANGGRIQVESQPGRGSIFSFTLPAQTVHEFA